MLNDLLESLAYDWAHKNYGVLGFMFLIALAALAIAALIFYSILVIKECDETKPVETKRMKVVSLSFTPSQTTTGFGPVSSGGIAMTTSTSSERDIVILKANGETIKIDNEELFNAVEIGDSVDVTYCNSWSRIRLTSYHFTNKVSLAQAKLPNKKVINVFGDEA